MIVMKNRYFGVLGVGVGVMVVAALTVVALSAQQGPPPGRGPGGPGGPGFGMMGGPGGPFGRGMIVQGLRQLNLTDDQKAQVKAIMQKHQPDEKALAEKGRPLRDALHAAVTADTFNADDIRAKALAVAAVEADAAVLRAQIHAEVFAVLTPDQQAQAKQLQAAAKARGGRGMMGWGGRGRGPGRGGFGGFRGFGGWI
jgi:periplasmic protein CpxP/Spy